MSLGKGQLINGAVNLFRHEPSNLRIGEGCLWGTTDIWTGDMHSIQDVFSGERTNQSEDVTVGDRVWFGAEALILKGAQIGDDSVISARSVVVSGTYRNTVVLSGFPASEIKSGIVLDLALGNLLPESFKGPFTTSRMCNARILNKKGIPASIL